MLDISYKSPAALKPYQRNARIHSKKQIEQLARSIKEFGFTAPIITDDANLVLAGHGRLEAAKYLKLEEVPTVSISSLSEPQKKAYILADNKLAEKADWNHEVLISEFTSLQSIDLDFDLTCTGFETPELDILLHDPTPLPESSELDDLPASIEIKQQVAKGDLWQLGDHYLYCGDSLERTSYEKLMGGCQADMVFTDPPYNVSVNRHVGGNGKIKHEEFAYASGEMSSASFTDFLSTAFAYMVEASVEGALHYICMDWRHIREITDAAETIYTETKNLCVWNKQIGGMGSLYRSQHELIFVFKKGNAPHINNIELGKYGRYRTNIWDYPGVRAGGPHRDELTLHPTVKPVMMIADAIKDCTKQRGIVLDSFGGSGSTLLAAQKTNRIAYLIEYEPHYCDVTLHRFEATTGITPKRILGGDDE